MSLSKIVVIAGVGAGNGTGAATARLFASKGYSIALIARRKEELEGLANEIIAAGGDVSLYHNPLLSSVMLTTNCTSSQAHAFPLPEGYSHTSLSTSFKSIKAHWPQATINVGLWNAASWTRKPFLEITEDEIKESLGTNLVGAFAFGKEVVGSFIA